MMSAFHEATPPEKEIRTAHFCKEGPNELEEHEKTSLFSSFGNSDIRTAGNELLQLCKPVAITVKKIYADLKVSIICVTPSLPSAEISQHAALPKSNSISKQPDNSGDLSKSSKELLSFGNEMVEESVKNPLQRSILKRLDQLMWISVSPKNCCNVGIRSPLLTPVQLEKADSFSAPSAHNSEVHPSLTKFIRNN
uniref:Uncharacterized protein n=1 Tax=Sphaerodactylus townsendi TaxID=933632 RepID=A0ACB8E7D0_9SAUR